MSRILSSTRYLILVPILGLIFAAGLFFVIGGIGLISELIRLLIGAIQGLAHTGEGVQRGEVIFEVVEFVHLFLVGTVLYITAVGLYQLLVQEIKFPKWLKIGSTEELETNLIGVTVVVLAVNFMGAVFVGDTDTLLQYGGGIALPIAALGLFVGLRAWSIKLGKEATTEAEESPAPAPGRDASPRKPKDNKEGRRQEWA